MPRISVSTAALLTFVLALAPPPPALAQDTDTATNFDQAIAGAERLGDGALTGYRTADRYMVAIDEALLDRIFFWYAEASQFPASAIAMGGNSVGETVISLHRQGNRLIIRDETPSFRKRSAASDSGGGVDEAIDIALDATTLGPALAALPILAESDGRILVDLTAAFSGDFDGLSAAEHIINAGFVPAPPPLNVDPARSYISDFDVYPDNLHIRSQLTFRAQNPAAPQLGFQPVSIEVGHSLVVLPETPMASRRYDDRVGFFFVDFTEFEGSSGEAATGPLEGLIKRFRLEKADPSAAVSDPVEPIVFYIGQGVPERWRRYIAQGIESWQPVFEAAGFSNAIQARQAPSPNEDPEWNPEDARHNVVRWVTQPRANAMGPSVADPRSGEILFAHILVWPDVIDFFGQYYWLMAQGVDPGASDLPLSEAKQGELLAYAVAHEVGHSIGLRHNHIASTAWSIEELRDPAFANENGPNASIMAYGRFNQAAQPGDGVTRVMPRQGPYDYFAIDWGYGVHGNSAAEEQAELDRLAAASVGDRLRRWAAGEAGFEEQWALDPRVLMENVGSDRIEATRLGLQKLGRSVGRLPQATSNPQLFRDVYAQARGRANLQIASVLKTVGGQLGGGVPSIVPAENQRAAVQFLLDEMPALLQAFAAPDVILVADPINGTRAVDAQLSAPVRELLSGPKLALLEVEQRIDPAAYGPSDLAEDVTDILWGNLEDQPEWRAAQQIAYLDAVGRALDPMPDPAAAAAAAMLTAQGHTEGYIANQTTAAADTILPAYARATLPGLREDVARAARGTDGETRLHFLHVLNRIDALLED